MKKLKTFLVLLMLIPLFTLNGFAQDIPWTWLGAHQDEVNSVTFSPDGSMLASASEDNYIRLWEVSTGRYIRYFWGHTKKGSGDGVTSVVFSPDGQMLASGGRDYTVRLWNVATSELIRTLEEHQDVVNSVAFSPDGQMLVSGSNDSTIQLWKVSTGELVRTFEGHQHVVNSVAFSPDGSMLVSGSYDNTIRLWEVTTGTHTRTFPGAGKVTCVAFSPDGSMLASTSDTVQLWKVSTGNPIHISADDLTEHVGDFTSVAFSLDGKTIAVGSYGNYGWRHEDTLSLWDVSTGRRIRTVKDETTVTNVVFSPDGEKIASTSGRAIELWSIPTGELIRTISGHEGTIGSLAFSPDGQTLVSGGGGHVRDYLVSGSFSGDTYGEMYLWDVSTSSHLRTIFYSDGFVNSVAFSLDGQTVAAGIYDSSKVYSIYLFKVPTGDFIRRFRLRLWDGATSVAFSPDGKTLACGSAKNYIRTSYNSNIMLWDIGTGRLMHELEGHKDIVNSVVFSPDGETLASGSSDGTIRLWNVSTGTLRQIFIGHTGKINSVVFALDGQTLVSGSSDNTIRLWNISTGTTKQVIAEHTDAVNSVVFSSNGTLLTSGSSDKTIKLWDFATGSLLQTIEGHSVAVNSVALSPDGKSLASGGADGILLWDISTLFESVEETQSLFADVNSDGVVNIQDLVLVASSLGQSVPEEGNAADVNGDGIVNILDLIEVSAAIESNQNAAPNTLSQLQEANLTQAEVQKWLAQVQQLNLTEPTAQRGIRYLEQLLLALTPKETALLPNYPNPFNPETWIPYQLAKPADVNISIYAADGKLVRSLDLGHQSVGMYQHRNLAAHWDGKNDIGESVASGVYFYTLKAGNFSATRKMLILK